MGDMGDNWKKCVVSIQDYFIFPYTLNLAS